MRDFAWDKTLYVVIKDDGKYAGSPCLTHDEARELSSQHKGSHILKAQLCAEKSEVRTGKIYCPVNGWDCPYYKSGECALDDPLDDCDDFGYFWCEGDDYICEDEPRTAFEDE